MAVPELTTATALQRSQFHILWELFDRLKRDKYELDTLSMGMSEDMDIAIAEGATMVRVGTAIFGPRRYPIPEELAAALPDEYRGIKLRSFLFSFLGIQNFLRCSPMATATPALVSKAAFFSEL